MNRFTRCLFRTAACVVVLCAIPVSALEPANEPAALKVRVNAPPSWNILLADRVDEAFVRRVRDSLSRLGWQVPVTEIRPVEDPAKVPYLLTLDVAEWRINATGSIECTVAATLQTPDGPRRFGRYTHVIPRWAGGSRPQSAGTFEPAADGSLSDLCRELARSGLLASGHNAARNRDTIASHR